MIFCYRCPSCQTLREVEARPGKQPKTVRCGCGARAERSYSDEGSKVSDAYQRSTNQYPYVSRRLPRGLEGCPTNAKGQPVILSQTHEREIMARHGYRRD